MYTTQHASLRYNGIGGGGGGGGGFRPCTWCTYARDGGGGGTGVRGRRLCAQRRHMVVIATTAAGPPQSGARCPKAGISRQQPRGASS